MKIIHAESYDNLSKKAAEIITAQIKSGATSFNQPIGNWDTRKVHYFGGMFKDATAFDQPLDGYDLDKNGFMAMVNGLDFEKGLDLILHALEVVLRLLNL